ncbi:aminotransferase class III-fold pyridoxal phosphate-dependent enzyme [Roseimaritima ulvae]|uniref:Acetylornithine aminotransferase n=1 Tax=Roseimaritima ulvae TaxID=980254 RepID=A0A5B9QZT6_9BACT|nr:aminotransferase class III-fold pyridoxal phosphate-dependent enzyme [Roseimaritima ulvae]QEG42676.1 Acetylornithine aminotransferase [Roseimaritima ulvae]
MNSSTLDDDEPVDDEPAGEAIDLFPAGGQAILGNAAVQVAQTIGQQAAELLLVEDVSAKLDAALRERLAAACFGTTAALTVCGDLATEWAIAAARIHGGPKYKVITFVGDYHGQSLAARAAAGDPQQQQDLGPLMAGFVHCPAGDAAAVAEAIDDQTAAILVQPLQTHDGLQSLPAEFLATLRQLADEHQLLLIFDETQLPIGVSGRFHYAAADEVVPDALVLAAGLAVGLPLGAVLLGQSLAASLENHPGLQTDPVSPLVAAAALATLQAIDDQSLLQDAQRRGDLWLQQLAGLQEDFEFVREVRGRGLLVAMELDVEAAEVQAQLRSHNVRVGTAGTHTLRLQPPLTISDEQLQRSVESLKLVFQTIEREPAIG